MLSEVGVFFAVVSPSLLFGKLSTMAHVSQEYGVLFVEPLEIDLSAVMPGFPCKMATARF